jgi:hypothetical protein
MEFFFLVAVATTPARNHPQARAHALSLALQAQSAFYAA